jgi:nucleoid DNA-binding protein
MLTLFGSKDKMSFNVPDEFLSLIRKKAKLEKKSATTVFKELVETMTEDLKSSIGEFNVANI